MPAFRIPLAPGEDPSISGPAEQLSAFLAPPNDPSMVARMGEETLKDQWVDIHGRGERYQGQRFRHRDGWVQGERYILSHANIAVAVLNVTQRRDNGRTQTRVSNVYVTPKLRRQGLASALLRRALSDHPKLFTDSSLSEAGAALMGVGPPAPRRSRTPR